MKKLSFEKLISLAQRESAPSVDVADDVITTLSNLALKHVNPYQAYAWIGTASAAVAACILIAATLLVQTETDSVSEIITYVSWIAQ